MANFFSIVLGTLLALAVVAFVAAVAFFALPFITGGVIALTFWQCFAGVALIKLLFHNPQSPEVVVTNDAA